MARFVKWAQETKGITPTKESMKIEEGQNLWAEYQTKQTFTPDKYDIARAQKNYVFYDPNATDPRTGEKGCFINVFKAVEGG